MKHLIVGLAFFGAAAAALSQPGPVRIYTEPKLPAREILERLDLKMAWHTRVKVDSTRDGFYSLQLIRGKTFTLLVAQTAKGAVVAINADTGDTLWRTQAGLPYSPLLPVAFNDKVIFACRHETIYALDRDNGKQLLYTIEHDSSVPIYGMTLESAPMTAPVADGNWLFACIGTRLVRYAVPNFRIAGAGRTDGGKMVSSPQLIRQWHFETKGDLSLTPVINRDYVIATTDAGAVFIVKKSAPADDDPEKTAEFKVEGAVVARPASHKQMLYVPGQDYFLYAYNTVSMTPSWRFAAQSAINVSPLVTDADLFVPVSNGGLYRLERTTGKVRWSNSTAVKFLATNQQFAYALDRVGNMLVLDYVRGNTMATWDVRDWLLPLANDLTDRIYLASNDGQIMCLRHRDFVRPLAVRTFEDPAPKGTGVKGMDPKKKANPPPDDGK